MSTPIARPVVAGIRLRKGKSADVRGAARFLAETLAVVRQVQPEHHHGERFDPTSASRTRRSTRRSTVGRVGAVGPRYFEGYSQRLLDGAMSAE